MSSGLIKFNYPYFHSTDINTNVHVRMFVIIIPYLFIKEIKLSLIGLNIQVQKLRIDLNNNQKDA